MTLEEKGMALGKRGMARRHAKRGWGKHYNRAPEKGEQVSFKDNFTHFRNYSIKMCVVT